MLQRAPWPKKSTQMYQITCNHHSDNENQPDSDKINTFGEHDLNHTSTNVLTWAHKQGHVLDIFASTSEYMTMT